MIRNINSSLFINKILYNQIAITQTKIPLNVPLLISNIFRINIGSCFSTSSLIMSKQSDSRISNDPSKASHDLSNMRRPYRDQDDGIEESSLPTRDPIKLFGNWFEMVKESGTVYEPNAVCVSTVGSSGQPTSRMVLLKGFGPEGFRFFTNLSSQKGRDLKENPKVAMLFYWDSFNRQVRIEGTGEILPESVAEEYFTKRPLTSQFGAAISDQCSLIESREALMTKYNDLVAKCGQTSPPRPPTWSGVLVKPERFEFWQGNTNRVHDRIIFRRLKHGEKPDGKFTRQAEDGWVMERLMP